MSREVIICLKAKEVVGRFVTKGIQKVTIKYSKK
jgi:hypothetical protein